MRNPPLDAHCFGGGCSHVTGELMNSDNIHQRLIDAIVSGDVEGATTATADGLDAGLAPLDLIQNGIVVGADRLGDMFQNMELYLPELVLGGEAAKGAMGLLLPLLQEDSASDAFADKVVIGTVLGDIHDIGKNLVAAMLGARAIDVIDLGVNVAPKEFVKSADQAGADIIGLSALMSTSLYYQEEVIQYLIDSGKRDKYYVVIGGGPVTPEWAQGIGADGCGRDASHAVDLCVKLLAERPAKPLAETAIHW